MPTHLGTEVLHLVAAVFAKFLLLTYACTLNVLMYCIKHSTENTVAIFDTILCTDFKELSLCIASISFYLHVLKFLAYQRQL